MQHFISALVTFRSTRSSAWLVPPPPLALDRPAKMQGTCILPRGQADAQRTSASGQWHQLATRQDRRRHLLRRKGFNDAEEPTYQKIYVQLLDHKSNYCRAFFLRTRTRRRRNTRASSFTSRSSIASRSTCYARTAAAYTQTWTPSACGQASCRRTSRQEPELSLKGRADAQVGVEPHAHRVVCVRSAAAVLG